MFDDWRPKKIDIVYIFQKLMKSFSRHFVGVFNRIDSKYIDIEDYFDLPRVMHIAHTVKDGKWKGVILYCIFQCVWYEVVCVPRRSILLQYYFVRAPIAISHGLCSLAWNQCSLSHLHDNKFEWVNNLSNSSFRSIFVAHQFKSCIIIRSLAMIYANIRQISLTKVSTINCFNIFIIPYLFKYILL